MRAILKREWKAAFYSPSGYTCTAVIVALYGFFYYQVMMTGSSSYVTAVYSMMFSFDMMIIPIFTMKSMAEEKKNHTDQALLTAPVNIWKIVTAKFLACFGMFFLASVIGLLPAVVMSNFARMPWKIIIGNFIGTICYSGAMIAIGIFLSSITISQIVAAISTFAVSMFLIYIDAVAVSIPIVFVKKCILGISFYSRYSELTRGIFSISSVFYFVSIILLFLYLTTLKTVEMKKGQWQLKSIFVGKIMIACALVVVANIVVGLLTERFPSLNPDLTSEKLNTLSEEAKVVIDEINQPIEVIIVAEEQDARNDRLYAEYGVQYSQIVNLLEKMQEQNRKITVEFKNPSKNPTFINEYMEEGIEQGDIMVLSETRHRILKINDLFVQEQDISTGVFHFSSQAESTLTNALAYVNMTEVPVISVAVGHGEMLDSSARAAFDSMARENAFEIQEVQIMTEEIPEETSILMIPTSTTDYTEDEISKVRKWLEDETDAHSRTIFFTAYPAQGEIPNLKNFLKEWGIGILNGTVFETDESRMFLTSSNTIFVKNTETILADENYSYLIAPVCSPLEIEFESNDGIYVFPLWVTADTTYIQTQEKEEETKIKEHIAGAYSYKQVHTEQGTAYRNMIVMGSSMALTSPYVDSDSFGNGKYFMDMLRLASNTKAYTAVPAKRTELYTMDITADRKTINFVGIGIFTIGIPVAILMAGIIVFYKRRHL